MAHESLPNATFKKYFEKLTAENKNDNLFQQNISNIFLDLISRLDASPDPNQLNGEITHDEILKPFKLLKNGKSSSVDYISNEMLKYGTETLVEPLHKLFNFIFDKGVFPEIWNDSLLVPLHKKGSKADPCNYRGLSISSNLGKLFNKIIHTRLSNFTLDNNLIRKTKLDSWKISELLTKFFH